MQPSDLRRSTRTRTAASRRQGANNETHSCIHCKKVCLTLQGLESHQKQDSRCRLMSSNAVFAPNRADLSMIALTNVPVQKRNEITTPSVCDDSNTSPNRNNPTTLPPLFSVEYPADSSDEEVDHIVDNLNNEGKSIPYPPDNDLEPDSEFPINEETDDIDMSNSRDDDEHLHPLFPTAEGYVLTVKNDFPIHPVRDITVEVMDNLRTSAISSVTDRMLLKLLVMLDDFKAPHYSFQQILKWIDECVQSKFLDRGAFGPTMYSQKRTTFITHLNKTFPDISSPTVTTIALEDPLNTKFHSEFSVRSTPCSEDNPTVNMEEYQRSGKAVAHIPHFDATKQILSLLSDHSLFADLNNLVVNNTNDPTDIFKPYQVKVGERLGEVNSGSWYQSLVKNTNIDVDREFIVPLISYIDATGTDAYSRFRLEPWLITTTLLCRGLRSKSHAWRTLGLVPDLERESSASRVKQRAADGGRSMNCRNYHRCIRTILGSLLELQKNGLVCDLRLGKYAKIVRLRFPMAFIGGDGKSNAFLTGKYGSHGLWVLRHCRGCFVRFDELSDSDHECFEFAQDIAWFLVTHLKNLIDPTSSNAIMTQRHTSSHVVENVLSISSSDSEEETRCNVGIHLQELRTNSSDDQPDSDNDVGDLDDDNNEDECNDIPSPLEDSLDATRNIELIRLINVRLKLAKGILPSQCYQGLSLTEVKVQSRSDLFNLIRQHLASLLGFLPLEIIMKDDWMERRSRLASWVQTLGIAETKEVLNVMAQHEATLATTYIDYCNDRLGVNWTTPTDLMHAFLLGVVRYAITSMVSTWPPRLKASVDQFAEQVLRQQSQTERRNFPRCDFSKGLSNLTQLTAQEWGGVCFSYMVILTSSPGIQLFKQALPLYSVAKSVQCLSLMLCFISYYKNGSYWLCGDTTAEDCVKTSIRKMMKLIVDTFPRKEGHGWHVSKLHELLHVTKDIGRYGHPLGYDASTGERLLKYFAKIPSQRSQKQDYNDFMRQVCCRLHESELIQRATAAWNLDVDPTTESCSDVEVSATSLIKLWEATMTIDGTTMGIDSDTMDYAVENERSLEEGKWRQRPLIAPTILQSIYEHISQDPVFRHAGIVTILITGFSEYRYTEKNQHHILRSHPAYRGKRPWYDWIKKSCSREDLEFIPCKVLSLFNWTLTSESAAGSNSANIVKRGATIKGVALRLPGSVSSPMHT